MKALLRKSVAPLEIPAGTVIQAGPWPFVGRQPQESYFDVIREEGDGPYVAVEPVATILGRAVRTDDGNMEITVLERNR